MAGNKPAAGGRLVADRFRRVWAIAQTIADEPGMTRTDLVARFNLSERQVQADLNIIRVDMALPLVRVQGYRFVDEGGSTSNARLSIQEMLTLIAVLTNAKSDSSQPFEQVKALVAKAPNFAPPHLRPLAAALLDNGRERRVMEPLTRALLAGGSVRLRMAESHLRTSVVVTPELLLRYVGEWYVLGGYREESGRAWTRMFSLTQVVSVEPVAIVDKTIRVVREAAAAS